MWRSVTFSHMVSEALNAEDVLSSDDMVNEVDLVLALVIVVLRDSVGDGDVTLTVLFTTVQFRYCLGGVSVTLKICKRRDTPTI